MKPIKDILMILCAAAPGLLLTPLAGRADDAAASSFYLKDGDNVCFYGDSITEQRFYGVDVETYVRTRFPNLHVKFVNSGVGGDKVTGGWAGRIDARLERDVLPFKPNVVTIMLGMNDAQYRAFDERIFGVYTNGYQHIIQSLQQHLPGVRIVLIEPSPYDDVTVPPKFPDGYNAVLLRYSEFLRQRAAAERLPCVDLNTPLVEVMKKAQAENPGLAHEVIPDRIHPSAAGELVMAQGILQAWRAPATVTAVAIDADQDRVAHADNTTVSDLKKTDGTLSWTQHDSSLPFPLLGLREDWPQFPPTENPRWNQPFFYWPAPAPRWDYTNAVAQMIVNASGFYAALDQEPLQVTGLPAGNYQLKINGQTVGTFSAAALGAGINLAEYHTPMLEQSYDVLRLVWKQVAWRYFAWRGIQLRLRDDHDPQVQEAAQALVTALEAQKDRDTEQQYTAAQPRVTHYELVPISR
jgi:lysophospholipase L1-like esterase